MQKITNSQIKRSHRDFDAEVWGFNLQTNEHWNFNISKISTWMANMVVDMFPFYHLFTMFFARMPVACEDLSVDCLPTSLNFGDILPPKKSLRHICAWFHLCPPRVFGSFYYNTQKIRPLKWKGFGHELFPKLDIFLKRWGINGGLAEQRNHGVPVGNKIANII